MNTHAHGRSGIGAAHHLLRVDLGLLVLRGSERRAGNGGAGDGGRAESGPGEGAEETGVHDGCESGGSARCFGGPIGGWRAAGDGETHRTEVSGPVEMDVDGCCVGS